MEKTSEPICPRLELLKHLDGADAMMRDMISDYGATVVWREKVQRARLLVQMAINEVLREG